MGERLGEGAYAHTNIVIPPLSPYHIDMSDLAINWHARTWRIAAPVIITNVSVPILGIVDTAVVGRLPGAEYVGAVAIGALIFSLLYHGCNFLRMGTTGLTAQAYGARNGGDVKTWLARALLFGSLIGVAMVMLQWPLFHFASLLVGPSDAVLPLAEDYFSVRIWAAPFALANFALLGWFFGVQDVRAALITQIYMNGVNVVLDIWFVLGLGWGVTGVAWATVIGETSALGLGLIFAARHLARMGGKMDRSAVFEVSALKRLMQLSRDIFIRSMCLQAAFVTLTAVGARMGDVTLAANAVLLHFQTFMAYALDGFATATEALAGEAFGAGKRRRFKAAVNASTIWAVAFSIIFAAIYGLFGRDVIDLITTIPEVRERAYAFVIWMIILPPVSVWSFQLDGIFIGCTWSREMRNSMILSLIAYIGAVVLLSSAFGNHGLWASLVVLMVARAVTLSWMMPKLVRQIPDNN